LISIRNLVQLLHKNGTFGSQGIYNVAVVYDFMSDVDGSAEFGQSLFYDLNCAIHAGTEATWRSEQNLERWLLHGHFDWLRPDMAERGSLYSSTAPENAVGCRSSRMVRSFSDNTRGRGSQLRGMLLHNSGRWHPDKGGAKILRRFKFAPAQAFALVSLGISAAALGGCGMSSLTSGLGGGMFGSGGSEGSNVSEAQLLDAAKSSDSSATGSTGVGEIDAGCPRLRIAPHDNYITFYEQGHVGDALSVAQRGEITKTARECRIEEGRVVVKYGFSGRVLLGPKGQAGNVTLPIIVVVNDSKQQRVTTDTTKVDVNIGTDKPISYFSGVHTVSFPIPEGSRPGEFEMIIGFNSQSGGSG